MNYHIKAQSTAHQDAVVQIKASQIEFGITQNTAETLPNPAELFLSSFASCILKNVERFSEFMKFSYTKAVVEVKAERLENPLKMDNIHYNLLIYSDDEKLNIPLLKRNIEKFGTIYNTVKLACNISGTINTMKNV